MQIIFTRWCVDPNGRTPVSIDPKSVSSTEHFTNARTPRYEGDDDSVYPLCAGTRITMKNKKEYLVQGDLVSVVHQLNDTETTK